MKRLLALLLIVAIPGCAAHPKRTTAVSTLSPQSTPTHSTPNTRSPTPKVAQPIKHTPLRTGVERPGGVIEYAGDYNYYNGGSIVKPTPTPVPVKTVKRRQVRRVKRTESVPKRQRNTTKRTRVVEEVTIETAPWPQNVPQQRQSSATTPVRRIPRQTYSSSASITSDVTRIANLINASQNRTELNLIAGQCILTAADIKRTRRDAMMSGSKGWANPAWGSSINAYDGLAQAANYKADNLYNRIMPPSIGTNRLLDVAKLSARRADRFMKLPKD